MINRDFTLAAFSTFDHRCSLSDRSKRALCRLREFYMHSDGGAVVVRAFCGWGEVWAGQVCHLPGKKIDTAVRNADLSCMVVWVSPDNMKS